MNDTVKENIKKELLELDLIQDIEIRNKVIEAWSKSLTNFGLSSISELEGAGLKDVNVLKEGTQVDHLRGVARIGYAIAKELKNIFPEMPISFDTVLAGGLLHDVGKTFTFNKDNIDKWKKTPQLEGNPAARHSVYGFHICLSVGLPMAIAHAVGAHSKEGVFIQRSLEGTLVYFADNIYWDILKLTGYLEDGTYQLKGGE